MPDQGASNNNNMDMPVRYFVEGEVVFCLKHQETLELDLFRFVSGPEKADRLRQFLQKNEFAFPAEESVG
ncbi:MAG: hypothetical protein KDE04_18860, partial [Anaerolineales bacterium]|nr:hypothetical protein [Anaerolineales bacterium]